MLTSVSFLKKNAARFACVAMVCGSALLTGCAGGSINNATQSRVEPQVRPDNIYVYTFDSSPEQVKLDNGGMLKKLKAQLDGSSTAQKQTADAIAVREQVANEIVQQLQSMGLRAIRSDVPAPADQNVLLVQGSFDTIDAGNRRRRVLIGLGAGKSEVSSSVQILYKPAGGTARLVQSFNASGDSGKAPGMAETAGWARRWAASRLPRPWAVACTPCPNPKRPEFQPTPHASPTRSPNRWRKSASAEDGSRRSTSKVKRCTVRVFSRKRLRFLRLSRESDPFARAVAHRRSTHGRRRINFVRHHPAICRCDDAGSYPPLAARERAAGCAAVRHRPGRARLAQTLQAGQHAQL